MPIDIDKVMKANLKIRDARMALHAEFLAKDAELKAASDQVLDALLKNEPAADLLTTLHLRLRDDKSVVAKAAEKMDEEFKGGAEKIEGLLLQKLLVNKAKSMNAGPATFYKEEVMKPSCSDWQAFYAFIKANDAFEAIEKRVTKAFIQQYVEAHDNELPPGINVHRETVVRVRRGKEG